MFSSGDLIWHATSPAGFCIFLGSEVGDCGDILYRVWHPTLGYLVDDSHYFDSIDRMLETARSYYGS